MDQLETLSSTKHRLGYHPALDGLRGMAVLSVLAYHGGVRQARGGFLGVDVFFVLSGFLITALLVNEWRQNGRIDIRAFWARRIKRLMPALIMLSLGMVVWLFFVADPAQQTSLRLDILATLGYVANWRFVVSGQSYFAQFADPSPLRHTWSLAVEEQWYLLWPLLVWAGLKVTKGRLGRFTFLVLGAAVASAVWAAVLWGNGDLSRIYYGTDTRAQELLIGSALALALAKTPLSLRFRRLFNLMGIVGLAGLIAGMGLIHDSNPFLYKGGLLVVSLAVGLVIVAGVQPSGGVVKSVLSFPPLRSLGKISYGLYLWHWPVNIILTSELTAIDGWALWAVRLEVSLILALISYFVIERPAQRMGAIPFFRSRQPSAHWSLGITRAATACGAMVVVATMVVVVQSPSGPTTTPGGLPSDAAIGTTLSTMLASSPTETIAAKESDKTEPAIDAPSGDTSLAQQTREKVKVLITGDSVAFTLGFGFSQGADTDMSVGVAAILGCGVVPGQTYVDGFPHQNSFSQCDAWEETWRRGMDDTKPDAVVMLLGAWEVLDREVGGQLLRAGTPEYGAYLEAQLTTAFNIVTENKTPVVLLTTPCYRETEAKLGGPDSDRNDPVRGQWFNQILQKVAKRYGSLVQPIDFGAYLCPGGEPREQINGVNMRYDGVHFSAEGSTEVWRWLAPKVRKAVKTSFQAG